MVGLPRNEPCDETRTVWSKFLIKRAGKLRDVADKPGAAAVSSATSAAVSALTNLAMQGAFG